MKPAIRIFTILALSLLFALPGAAGAQEKKPAAAKPEIETTAYGDWKLRCYKFKDGKKFCELLQLVANGAKDGKKKHMLLIAKADIVPIKEKDGKTATKTRMLLLSPLGTLLPARLAIKLDGEKPVTAPFIVCIPDGCTADLTLEGELLDKFKKGKKMQVTYKRINNQPVTASVSLNGFGAGLQALAEKNP